MAEELKAPVLIHPWDMEQGGRYKDYWAPWLVGKSNHDVVFANTN